MKRRIAVAGSVALVVAMAGAYYVFQRDMARAEQRVAMGSRMAQTACGPIEYAEVGDCMPVLIVHGAGGGIDQGLEFGEDLAQRGLRAIAMSRFGYLRTPLPADASPAAQADAHACLLDFLHLGRAAIIGASAGAPSALQLALRHPDRVSALVLVVPALYAPRPSASLVAHAPAATQFFFDTALKSDLLFWAATKIGRRTLTHALLATPSAVVDNASPDERARVSRMLDHILPVSPRRAGLLNDAAITARLPRYPLEQVGVRTLVISVEDDLFGTFDSARYTAEHVPGARFIGYPTGGHVWVGHQGELLAEIAGFLRGPTGADVRVAP